MANVTPITPATLPYTYTANFGQAYQLASVSAQGCVDTVYPLTANAGGVFNVKGVPLTATQALTIIQQANGQFGPLFVACQSLLNQVGATSVANSTSGFDLLTLMGAPTIGAGWFVDDIAAILVLIVGVGAILWVAEKLGIYEPKKKR